MKTNLEIFQRTTAAARARTKYAGLAIATIIASVRSVNGLAVTNERVVAWGENDEDQTTVPVAAPARRDSHCGRVRSHSALKNAVVAGDAMSMARQPCPSRLRAEWRPLPRDTFTPWP